MWVFFRGGRVGCDQVDRGDGETNTTSVSSLIMVLWRRGGGDLGLQVRKGKGSGIETGNHPRRPKTQEYGHRIVEIRNEKREAVVKYYSIPV